jgi:hypothetical protein
LASLQPARHPRFHNLFQHDGDASFAEVFLREDIDRDLRPRFRNEHILHLENRRSVRIHDARGARRKSDRRKGILTGYRIPTWNVHISFPTAFLVPQSNATFVLFTLTDKSGESMFGEAEIKENRIRKIGI